MRTSVAAVCAVALCAIGVAAADNTFTSTWTAPGVHAVSYAGRKVAALVIVDDLGLRMSAEEALAREITARGPVGVAAYRLIPKEELANKDRARAWFERVGVEGVVTMRLVAVEKEKVYSSAVWSSGYYGNFWDYYGTAWTTVIPLGKGREETTIAVETLLYDVPGAIPLWAGVSRTTDPKDAGSFMKSLTRDILNELKKAGLIRKGGK